MLIRYSPKNVAPAQQANHAVTSQATTDNRVQARGVSEVGQDAQANAPTLGRRGGSLYRLMARGRPKTSESVMGQEKETDIVRVDQNEGHDVTDVGADVGVEEQGAGGRAKGPARHVEKRVAFVPNVYEKLDTLYKLFSDMRAKGRVPKIIPVGVYAGLGQCASAVALERPVGERGQVGGCCEFAFDTTKADFCAAHMALLARTIRHARHETRHATVSFSTAEHDQETTRLAFCACDVFELDKSTYTDGAGWQRVDYLDVKGQHPPLCRDDVPCTKKHVSMIWMWSRCV